MSLQEWVQPGARAYVSLKGQQVAARILETTRSPKGDCWHARLKIAVANPLAGGKMLVSPYPKPVSSDKLKQRYTTIPELDKAV